ncbi:MAG TPA: hypothetical protein VN850_08565 [Candidatus Acidoferrales bacterium]|nr:hypothetical protein [Candidatus Acidoferrales bacterium]
MQPGELMRNCTKFRLHRALSNPQWSTPLKNLSPRVFGLSYPPTRTIRNTHHISLICLALLLFTTATALRAQDQLKQNERQQEAEPKQDREQGKKGEKHKKGEPTPRLRAVIWHATIDVDQLNLFYGAGGKEDAPTPGAKYKFKKEDMNGTSPKFDVEDDQGIKWRVKLGQEPRAETAATRLLFAAGYFVDEDYYIDELHVEGLPPLKRGQSFVTEGGIVHGARLERRMKEVKKLGNWDWFKNPFADTKEFNGLRVMMALVNDWDLKTINNSIYEVTDEAEYAVSDVGATFGKTGSPLHRSKSVLKDYEDSKFIDKVTTDFVDFVMHSRPPLLAAINIPNYEKRTQMQSVTKHIPRADAKWLGERLAQLREEQIRDCFRAGGYTQEEIEGYATVIQNRIAALNAL